MPYKLFKQRGKFCVRNTETGENKGCSDTRDKAVGHMRRLYQVENEGRSSRKEAVMSDNLIDELIEKAVSDFEAEYPQENEEKSIYEAGYICSYEQLEQEMEAREKTAEMSELAEAFPILARNILFNPEITDKSSALKQLADELGERLSGMVDEEDDDLEGKESADCVDCEDDPEGTEEKAISRREDVSEADKKRAVGEYGNVTYADPKNKKYPIDTEGHIRAAWNYINKPKNAAKYSSSEVRSIKGKIVSAWKRKIDKAGPPSAKELNFIERVTEAVKERLGLSQPEQPEENMLIWKEGSQWFWMARYSNNFRDRDNPPEIISAKSHIGFAERVDKGLAPYPELWLWHVPEWKLGDAFWHAYDDAGFPIAAGRFTKGLEQVAEWLSTKEDVLVSHGMPPKSIVRDDSDPTVIIQHDTVEISPLPSWAAANVLTGFISVTKEDEMAIPQEKRKALIERWGMPLEMVERIEAMNAQTAEKAVEEGIESKETTETETPAAETAPVETPATTEETEPKPEQTEEATEPAQDATGEYPTRKEVAEAVANVVVPALEAMWSEIQLIKEKVGTLAQSDEQKIANLAKETPMASLSALLAESVIGKEVTHVDGRSTLSKGPKETTPPQDDVFGIPFLTNMLSEKQENPS